MPRKAGNRYVIFQTHSYVNPATPAAHVCALFLWQVGRGGQRGAVTLRCLLSEKTVCRGHVSLHPSVSGKTGLTLRVRSVGYVSSLHPAV